MCPACGFAFLQIRKRSGLERIMIRLTGKRKYLCTHCLYVFRMVDRRRFPRVVEAGATHPFPETPAIWPHPTSGRTVS